MWDSWLNLWNSMYVFLPVTVLLWLYLFIFIHVAKNKIKKAENYWELEHLPKVHVTAKLLHIFKNAR